jgi:RNA polymerase sigma-70 factor, ECF subfamily
MASGEVMRRGPDRREIRNGGTPVVQNGSEGPRVNGSAVNGRGSEVQVPAVVPARPIPPERSAALPRDPGVVEATVVEGSEITASPTANGRSTEVARRKPSGTGRVPGDRPTERSRSAQNEQRDISSGGEQRAVVDPEQVVRDVKREHGSAILAYATRLTGDYTAAEDVVQETLIRAWKHAGALSDESRSVRGWLLTVARNIVTDRARARRARPTEVAENPLNPPMERDHSDGVVDTMVVLDGLGQLSQEHRRVLVEVYYRGRTTAEAAEVLGVPAGTVKSRTYYALRALRAALGDTIKETK